MPIHYPKWERGTREGHILRSHVRRVRREGSVVRRP